MRILAPFRGQVASGKDRGRPVAETLSALMNCGLKIIKNRLHSGRILGSYGFGTKFQVRSSSRRARKLIETIQLSKYDSLLDITIQEGIPYPACRRGVAAAEFAAKAANSRRRLFIQFSRGQAWIGRNRLVGATGGIKASLEAQLFRRFKGLASSRR